MSENINIQQGGWKFPRCVPKHSWRNPFPWIPPIKFHKGLGLYLKFPKIPEVPLIDSRPTKNVKIEKVGLFDLLPTDILKVINDWSISFK